MSLPQRVLLLIDDNLTDRNVAKRFLLRDRTHQYVFVDAETGDEGLALCRVNRPDCILMDYNLPDTNGLELLADLHSDEVGSQIPIVLMTGSGDETIAVQAMQGGAQDYLVKSKMTPEALLLAINNAIEKVNLQRSVEEQQQRLIQQNAELHQRQEEIQTLNVRLKRAMAESHHRIKNNLQVLAALVEMQTSETEDALVIASMQRIGNSIRTMAMLHDLLTREAKCNGDIDTVPVQHALADMMPLLQDMAGDHEIILHIAAPDIRLSLKRVTPLVMLVNELISNALKHGGKRICLDVEIENGAMLLAVSDNGPGFPDGFDPSQASNTGLDLIMILVRHDLNGEITFNNQPSGGACVQVKIPITPQYTFS